MRVPESEGKRLMSKEANRESDPPHVWAHSHSETPTTALQGHVSRTCTFEPVCFFSVSAVRESATVTVRSVVKYTNLSLRPQTMFTRDAVSTRHSVHLSLQERGTLACETTPRPVEGGTETHT